MPRGGRARAVSERIATAVAEGMPERLHSLAVDARDAEEAYQFAIERRDKAIVEALDVEGIPQTAVAEWCGFSKSRVHGILVKSQPGAGEEA